MATTENTNAQPVGSPEDLPPGYRAWQTFEYTNGAGVVVAANSANVANAINIQADADYEWRGISILVDDGAGPWTEATRVISGLTMQYKPEGTQQPWTSDVLKVSTIQGNGGLPFIWPWPKFAPAKTGISFSFSNPDAKQYTVFITLFGRKLFIGA